LASRAPEVPALDRVVEQPQHRIAVVLVVLGGVDAALGGDRMGPARTVLDTEGLDVVALFGQGGRGRGPGQAGADDNDRELAAIRRVDQFAGKAVVIPFLRQISGRNAGIEFHRLILFHQFCGGGRRGRFATVLLLERSACTGHEVQGDPSEEQEEKAGII